MRLGKPVTVEDDAGKPVVVLWLDWRNHAAGLTKVDDARRELAMRLMPNMNFLREPITKKSLGRFTRFFGPILFLYVVVGASSAFFPRMPWLMPAVVGLSVAVVFQYFIARELQRDPKESLNTALAEGCCAGCLYSLADLRTPNMTTCPECGASWRTDRIGMMRGSMQTAATPLGSGQTLVSGEASVSSHERSAVSRWLEMMRLSNTPVIADARERRVRLVDGKLFYVEDRRTCSLTPEQLERARKAMKMGRGWTIAFVAFFVLMILPAVLVQFFFARSGFSVPGLTGLVKLLMKLVTILMPLFSVFVIVYTMYPAIRGWRPRNAPKAARKLADAYVCPCCGGTLMNVETDEKGNRTCSSCQSTWQTDFPKVA
ncbi:MAG: hypothetical protein U0640_10780 [Phycisphaerales bacterium]